MRHEVSIIIPTYHRKESVLRLLKNLAMYARNNEIIIVEQGENHETEIQKEAKKRTISVQYIFLPKPSTAHAMNVGVRNANGKYLLFLDDDVLVKPGTVDYHVKNFSDSRVGATVGRAITKGQKIEEERRDTARVNWLGQFKNGYSSIIRQEVDTVIGCNTCWRKSLYQKLGGIDEQFTGNAMRLESDLSFRARKAGAKIIFEPKAEVEHLREETGGARKTEGRIQWYFNFFSNETYFFLKHFPNLLLPVFLTTKLEWILRCMFGFGREVSIRSFYTPIAGVINGIKKYRIGPIYENWH